MTRTLRALGLTLALTVAIAGSAAAAVQRPNLLSLESQYICLSCHEPLELVSSPQAQSEKDYLAGLIAKGKTAAEIRTSMVAQYGVAVLGRPPAQGFDLTIYILPPAVLAVGVAVLLYTLPRWRERARRAAAAQPQMAPPLPPSDAARLDDELTRFI